MSLNGSGRLCRRVWLWASAAAAALGFVHTNSFNARGSTLFVVRSLMTYILVRQPGVTGSLLLPVGWFSALFWSLFTVCFNWVFGWKAYEIWHTFERRYNTVLRMNALLNAVIQRWEWTRSQLRSSSGNTVRSVHVRPKYERVHERSFIEHWWSRVTAGGTATTQGPGRAVQHSGPQ